MNEEALLLDRIHLHDTGALCPDCLRELPAEVYADAEGVVWMERTCPEHAHVAGCQSLPLVAI